MIRIPKALLAAACLAALLPFAAAAQEAAPGSRNIQANETHWQANCAPSDACGTLACTMSKSLILPEGNRVLAQAAVVHVADGLKMRIMAPHGMSVPERLTVSVDGREVAKAPYITSLPAGIVGLLDLTPDIEEALRLGNTMTVTGTQNSGQSFVFKMSLVGFSASIEKVR